MNTEFTIEEMVEDCFDNFIAEYELDPEGSINDMFFELFLAGFEAACEMMDDEEDE